MSTDWGIGCRDCAPPRDTSAQYGLRPHDYDDAYFTGEWNNCRDLEALRLICAAANEIVAIDDKINPYVLITWRGQIDEYGGECLGITAFMRSHRGHRLAPMSEYRLFADEEL